MSKQQINWTAATTWAIEQLLERTDPEWEDRAISLLMEAARRLDNNAKLAKEALCGLDQAGTKQAVLLTLK